MARPAGALSGASTVAATVWIAGAEEAGAASGPVRAVDAARAATPMSLPRRLMFDMKYVTFALRPLQNRSALGRGDR
ncbi:hypothetical protein ATO4_05654 [Aurantimonas sp. 22II-16-19i]|nr:hypothetical protein ATO4_05654 [Aurantimonas sp. 22II-16-19i]